MRWSTGKSKKPWICPVCRSTVTTRSAPATVSRSASEPRGDRLAALGLPVLARVRVERDDRGDALRRRALGRVDQDELLHDAVVDRARSGSGSRTRRRRARSRRSGCRARRWRSRRGPRRRGSRRGTSRSPRTAPRCRARRTASAASSVPAPSTARSRHRPSPSSSSRLVAVRGLRFRCSCAARPPSPPRPRRHALGQRARRHVVRHDRARARVRAVADLDRRHQGVVRPDPHVLADLRAVLAEAVVVGGDRAGADVGARADVGVAQVGRGGCAFAPSPMSEFFASTKLPSFAPAPTCVPGRRCVYGPTLAPSPISASCATVLVMVARSPTIVSTRWVSGPITEPAPMTVRPSRIVPGSRRTSGSSSTDTSM